MRAYSSSVYSGKSWNSLVSLAAIFLELVLSLANHLDERLGGLKTTGNDFLIGLGLALVVDEVPGVLAGASLDHGDGNVTVLDHAASDHNLEHGALTLAPTREGNPLAVDQRQTHTGDRAFERQAGDHGGGGSSVQGDDIVSVIGVHGEHGLDDLHFVAQGVREQRARGRSMIRQARMASELGRPSRRKNEPGTLPAAYIFSSTSTVSGKKS